MGFQIYRRTKNPSLKRGFFKHNIFRIKKIVKKEDLI